MLAILILFLPNLTAVQIITNVFVQAIILLYLIDNNENTSWMILLGSGMGVVIEAWKVCSEDPYLRYRFLTPFIIDHEGSGYQHHSFPSWLTSSI
jgi:hypothetical protein